MAEAPAIVAVDDEAYQRRVLVEFLARNGLRATALASGAELKLPTFRWRKRDSNHRSPGSDGFLHFPI
jgi:hypothetical protein